MCTEATACAEIRPLGREVQAPAEAEARRLVGLCRAAREREERRRLSLEVHRARQLAQRARVERARERVARSGTFRAWREARCAPRTLPRPFELSEGPSSWPALLQTQIITTLAATSGVERVWVQIIKQYIRVPDEPDCLVLLMTPEEVGEEVRSMRPGTYPGAIGSLPRQFVNCPLRQRAGRFLTLIRDMGSDWPSAWKQAGVIPRSFFSGSSSG